MKHVPKVGSLRHLTAMRHRGRPNPCNNGSDCNQHLELSAVVLENFRHHGLVARRLEPVYCVNARHGT